MSEISPLHREIIQMIDDQGGFLSGPFSSSLERARFDRHEQSYTILSVLGCQSSGKSTLLNALFSTSFAELGSSDGRHQTTCGIWAGVDPSSSLLVFDTEGTDSNERGEKNASFEKRVGLFSLAVSDVLMINLWYHDIGRYTASNYALLRIVLELNLLLFSSASKSESLPNDAKTKTSSRKVLLFVIRDHEVEQNSLEKLSGDILKSVHEIWNGISKPETCEECVFEDFFECRFYSLPHYLYRRVEFDEGVARLRDSLLSYDSSESIVQFRHDLPSESLCDYFDQIWSTVLANKDLDIPSQKEIVSKSRCEEISSQLLSLVLSPFVREIEEQVMRNEVWKGFAKAVLSKLDDCTERFRERTKYYDSRIVSQMIDVIHEKFSSSLEHLFHRQVAVLRKEILQFFTSCLDTNIADGSLCENFGGIIDDSLAMAHEEFSSSLAELLVDEFQWTTVESERTTFDEEVRFIVEERRRTQLGALRRHLETSAEAYCSSQARTISSCRFLTHSLWSDAQNILRRCSGHLFDSLRSYRDSLRIRDADMSDWEDRIVSAARSSLLGVFKKIAQDPSFLLQELFEKYFYIDGKGVPRVWSSQGQVDQIVRDTRNKIWESVDRLLLFRLECPYDEIHLTFCGDEGVDAIEYPNEAALSSIFVPGDIIFSPENIRSIETQMNSLIRKGYSDALQALELFRRGSSIPYWVWALIVILGWNEFMAILSSPIGIAFIIVGLSISYAYWKMPIFRSIVEAASIAFQKSLNGQDSSPSTFSRSPPPGRSPQPRVSDRKKED